MSAKRWLDAQVKIDPIKNQSVAVIGYGIQGRAQANNMKDSGINVVIGLRKDGKTWKLAEQDGHKVIGISEVCIWRRYHPYFDSGHGTGRYGLKYIAPYMTEGNALSFSTERNSLEMDSPPENCGCDHGSP